MPELPEVETITHDLRQAHLVGRTIIKAHIFWEGTIAFPEAGLFCTQISGETIKAINRRGKWIAISLKKFTLLIHLRMTGNFSISSTFKDPIIHERISLELDDGRRLYYSDQRKFGKWHLLQDPTEKLAQIGIEPLSDQFQLETFQKMLNGRRRNIKSFLLDQAIVAGLGNIYVDESLWEAKIHPKRAANQLSSEEGALLWHAIRKVLTSAIDQRGTSLGHHLGNYRSLNSQGDHQKNLNVFSRQNRPCLRCKSPICKIVIAQRGTHYCPSCQEDRSDDTTF